MKTSDFDYSLPPDLIAQTPIEPRSQSRLMVVNRSDGSIEHHSFYQISDYLREGDVLVFNNSKVIPARLKGKREDTGGKVEIFLLRRIGANIWETLVKPGRRVRVGSTVTITGSTPGVAVTSETISAGEGGSRVIRFSDENLLPELGEIPLPPYIRTPLADRSRYQTVYADAAGSVAAPTAGLHFTPELIDEIQTRGVQCLFTTLHIGLDTFRPVHEDDPIDHKIHREYGVLSQAAADAISAAKREGRRIICVGTTAARLVEAAAQAGKPGEIQPFSGWVDLFILPGYRFQIVDALITNFHLPKSTLLMLVSAFAGKSLIDKAYREAILERYRFYSFGDAMLVL